MKRSPVRRIVNTAALCVIAVLVTSPLWLLAVALFQGVPA